MATTTIATNRMIAIVRQMRSFLLLGARLGSSISASSSFESKSDTGIDASWTSSLSVFSWCSLDSALRWGVEGEMLIPMLAVREGRSVRRASSLRRGGVQVELIPTLALRVGRGLGFPSSPSVPLSTLLCSYMFIIVLFHFMTCRMTCAFSMRSHVVTFSETFARLKEWRHYDIIR
jgi:hypothetical protein